MTVKELKENLDKFNMDNFEIYIDIDSKTTIEKFSNFESINQHKQLNDISVGTIGEKSIVILK